MSVLNVSKLYYSIGVEQILCDVTCNVNAGDRIGIVGVNGAGKSTFLRLLMHDYQEIHSAVQTGNFGPEFEGLESYEKDSGTIAWAREINLQYLNLQHLQDSYDGFDMSTASGGEKVKAALEAAFKERPDFLVMDEPTNHLDIDALQWLEARLRNFRGTFLVVSHDRYFMDRVCNRIFEIENKKLTAFTGNYSEYKEQKKTRYEIDMRHYEQQMAEIRRQEDIAREFRARATEKMIIRAKARETMISKMERPERPGIVRDEIRLNFKQSLQTGNDVLIIEDLAFGFDDEMLFEDFNLILKKGERLLITGPNGCGKTTFLRMLLGELPPVRGRIKLGTNVLPAYYDQQQAGLKPENTVLEELYNCPGIIIGPNEYVSVQSRYNETELRSLLGGFCFRGDDVFKKVGSLAGGEKARLALLKLMMSGANVLILDEPTNHLDITSKEIFEDALLDFPGTEIIVSHDRYLIDKVATKAVQLSGAQGAYSGAFAEQLERGGARVIRTAAGSAKAVTDAEADRLAKKAAETERRRAEKRKASLEAEIAGLEERIAELEKMLCDPEVYSDQAKAMELSEEMKTKKSELDRAESEWLALCE